MAAHRAEVEAIATSPAAPTFANTVAALGMSGERLASVQAVFGTLVASQTTAEIQAIQREMAPRLTRHRDDTMLDDRLFQKVKVLWDGREALGLEPDQKVLLERTWKAFVRSGARLDPARKERLKALNGELTSLGVKFGDNLLAATNGWRLELDRPEQLAGLPAGHVAAMAEAARKAGLPGKWVVTLHGPSLWPFLKYADDRELRKRAFEAYSTRCDQAGPWDNRAVASRTAALRVEKARLLGYPTWADYVLDDQMAGTPAAAYALIAQLWDPAKGAAAREARLLEDAIRAAGKSHPLEPWDWFYFTEKVRKSRYDLDENELRPYFPLDQVRAGAFDVAHRLYGITFTELRDFPRWDPEVRAFEVKDRDGSHLAVFLVDYHPRPGKRSGAWASGLRGQWVKDGKEIRPIVTNTGNFTRPAGDAPALLSQEEVETLFHELGHGLHSILSRRRYEGYGPMPRDFVELGSQVMENWAFQPEVLAGYARHWKTGEPIPAALVEKIQKSARFDQGFKNTEYLAAVAPRPRVAHPLGSRRARRGHAGADRALAHGHAVHHPAPLPHHVLPAHLRPGRRLRGRVLQLQVGRGARRRRLRGLRGEGALRPGHGPGLPRAAREGAIGRPHGTLREVPGTGAVGGAAQAQARARAGRGPLTRRALARYGAGLQSAGQSTQSPGAS